ncbi:hypothetical protein Tco_0829024 [Tanacetum coccineum]
MAVESIVPPLVDMKGDDIMESVISNKTAKATWTDLVHSIEGPFGTKENRIMDLKLEYQTFRDFQENSDDEVDERTSEEYLKDLELEFHERPLRQIQNILSKGKKNQVKKKMKTLIVTNVAKKDEKEVFDDEEMTQVKVLMALADDELSVRKNHAQNGEWINSTMRKRHIMESIWYLNSRCSRISLCQGIYTKMGAPVSR